jgi:hypothetical protein
LASSHGARIHTSHSSSGIAFGSIGSYTAFGAVVRKRHGDRAPAAVVPVAMRVLLTGKGSRDSART